MKKILISVGIFLITLNTHAASPSRMSCDVEVKTVIENSYPTENNPGTKTMMSRQYLMYVASDRGTPPFSSRLSREEIAGMKVIDHEAFTADGRRVHSTIPFLDLSRENDSALAFASFGSNELPKGNYVLIATKPVGQSVFISAVVYAGTKPLMSVESFLEDDGTSFVFASSPEAARLQAEEPNISFSELIQRLPLNQPFHMYMTCHRE